MRHSCRELATRFPDGCLWVTLGEELTAPVSLQTQLASALHGKSDKGDQRWQSLFTGRGSPAHSVPVTPVRASLCAHRAQSLSTLLR
eukprot:1097194-Pyramimonas_sp.AAC.1